MEIRKYTIEETEPTVVSEPQVAYNMVEQDDFDKEWERSVSVEEFYEGCIKRINEIFA